MTPEINEYNYTVYHRKSGAYVKNLDMPTKQDALLNTERSQVLVSGEYGPNTYLEGDKIKECDPQPEPFMVWDNRHNGWYDPRNSKDLQLAQEQKILENRGRRNKLLDDTDKMVVSDRPMTEQKRNVWLVYRQKLRDITDFVNPVWPEKPE